MLETDAYHLNDSKFKELYTKELTEPRFPASLVQISITFTLHPIMNKADILTQYRAMIKEIRSSNIFFYKAHRKAPTFTIHPGFDSIYLCPELTSSINTHIHGILIIKRDSIDYFNNEIRKLLWNSKVLGRQFSYTHIDDKSYREAMCKYPFKDTDQLLKFPCSDKMYYFRIQDKNI